MYSNETVIHRRQLTVSLIMGWEDKKYSGESQGSLDETRGVRENLM